MAKGNGHTNRDLLLQILERLDNLEKQRVGERLTEFRNLWLVAHLENDQRLRRIEKRLDRVEGRLTRVEKHVGLD